MALAAQQKRQLRQLGHHLKPVVIVGQAGLTDAVLAEADLALTHHELLKMRLNAADRKERREMVEKICEALDADLVNTIGHIALIFRRNPDKPKIPLSPAPANRK